MNQKIKELIDQSTDTIEIVNPDTGITHRREFFDTKKFSQLIVRECIDIAEQTRYDGKVVAERIKFVFGVKE